MGLRGGGGGGGSYFRRGLLLEELLHSKWVGLDKKNGLKHEGNNLKQLKTTNPNSPWAYIHKHLGIIGRKFVSEIWGADFGRAYFWRVYFWRGL